MVRHSLLLFDSVEKSQRALIVRLLLQKCPKKSSGFFCFTQSKRTKCPQIVTVLCAAELDIVLKNFNFW